MGGRKTECRKKKERLAGSLHFQSSGKKSIVCVGVVCVGVLCKRHLIKAYMCVGISTQEKSHRLGSLLSVPPHSYIPGKVHTKICHLLDVDGEKKTLCKSIKGFVSLETEIKSLNTFYDNNGNHMIQRFDTLNAWRYWRLWNTL